MEKQANCFKQNQGNQISLHHLIAPFHHDSEHYILLFLKDKVVKIN